MQPQEHPRSSPSPRSKRTSPARKPAGSRAGSRAACRAASSAASSGAPVPNTGPRMVAPQIGKGLLLIDPNEEHYRVKLPPALVRTA